MSSENITATASMEARLQRIEAQNDAIIKALQKKKKNIVFGLEDENEERGNWSGRFDFFLSCLGYAVGLGNVWRFPYLCYKNGGGAFFIPYFIMLFFIGMPQFFLELSLGQFTSCGSFACWKYAPIFQGLGYGMFVVSSMVSIYYNMIIAWAIYYLFASFTSSLPWEKCDTAWSSNMCLDYIQLIASSAECGAEGWTPLDNGVCVDRNDTIVAIYNQTLAKSNGIQRQLPSKEYYERYVTRSYYSDGLQDLGPMQWKLVLCYLLAFILVALALSKSIKSSGKVVYFTATFPYIVLLILLIRGLYLDGHQDGIDFFITPDVDKLTDSAIWKDAAVQIFFSLSVSWGGLITLASYNRFKNDVVRDAVVVALCNSATSIFAGFVIFSYLGNLAYILGVPVDEVAESGPSLAFIVYPYAVTKLPAAPFWAIIFFLMLITLGVDSQFVLVETVVTSVMDRFPKFRPYNFMVVLCICCIFFLLGLTLTTEGGPYMLEVMDTYSAGWNVMFLSFCECTSICYVYGVRRFLTDIETMVGKRFCGFAPFFFCKFWWAFNWGFNTPLIIAATMIFSWVDYTDMEGEKYPDWADALGWLMTLAVVVAAIIGAVVALVMANGTFKQKLREVVNPTIEWGPALVKHRELVAKYIPGFVIDPRGKEVSSAANGAPNDFVNLEVMNEKETTAYNGPDASRM